MPAQQRHLHHQIPRQCILQMNLLWKNKLLQNKVYNLKVYENNVEEGNFEVFKREKYRVIKTFMHFQVLLFVLW